MEGVNEEQYISRFGRVCSVCGLVRYWSCFARSETNPTGFEDICTECKSNQTGAWYAQKEQKHA